MSDLVESLKVTPDEVLLVAEMTIGQRNNALWMDARQWRLTASNFGRIVNRKKMSTRHHYLKFYWVIMDL